MDQDLLFFDKRTTQEVENLHFDTDNGESDDLHSISYDIKLTDPDTPMLH